MNIEKSIIGQVTPIKFTGGDSFIIPNHSGIMANTDAKNNLDRTPTNYRGTDFNLGSLNPTKTLTHIRPLRNNVILVIGGRVMHRDIEYTISGNTITMVNVDIDDADYVMVCD